MDKLGLILIGVLVASLVVAAAQGPGTSPAEEQGILVVGRVVDSSGQPLRAWVEAWQVSEFNARATGGNYWQIPGWVMPRARTDANGRFTLRLRDYPQLRTHQYYVIVQPDGEGWAGYGFYVTMTRYRDGQTVDVGQIAINREIR